MKKISIKFTVVSLFIFFAALIVSVMFYIQHTFTKDLVKQAMDNQLYLLSSKVEDSINHMNNNNSNIVNNVSDFLENKNINDFTKDKNKYIKIFTNILKNNTNLYSVYVGFEDDSFFELINLNIDAQLKQKYHATKNDDWLFIEIINNQKKIILLDKDLKITSENTVSSDYFATSRPWYKKSIKVKTITKTEPYSFSNIASKGVTYSKIIPNTNNVFSLDILINKLNSVLKKYSGTTLQNSYILTKDGKIIANSSLEKNEKVFNKIVEIIKEEKPQNHILKEEEFNNKKYIYSILLLKGEYLCSYGEIDNIIKPYKEKLNFMLFIMVLLMLTLFPLIFYFSSIIVKPILLLVQESKKVKNREFDHVQKIDTRVLEISNLSISLADMSKSIYEYQINLEKKVEERTIELNEKNKELEKLSITDKLTGLYNRIKLDKEIDNEIERVNRYDDIFGIIIIDIDFFKSVNDTYGHQVGDSVLQEFASILNNYTRKTDTVGRWGGEEFIIICPASSLNDILHFAEKIRFQIENFNFTTVEHKTASFGVASYQKGEKVEAMINRADQALYIAKENGRNRVETIE